MLNHAIETNQQTTRSLPAEPFGKATVTKRTA
jgi:hypothetical protein